MDEGEETSAVALPWVEKYRPSGLDDLVAHEEIISVLTRLIDTNR
jgi:replication factor C subunit 3/5